MSDAYHFQDCISALLFLIGARCLTNTPNPQNTSGLRSRLICDGCAIEMWMPTKHSGIRCTAALPHRMTQDEFAKCHWLSWANADTAQLRDLEVAGHA
jgi:hypothetical protein